VSDERGMWAAGEGGDANFRIDSLESVSEWSVRFLIEFAQGVCLQVRGTACRRGPGGLKCPWCPERAPGMKLAEKNPACSSDGKGHAGAELLVDGRVELFPCSISVRWTAGIASDGTSAWPAGPVMSWVTLFGNSMISRRATRAGLRRGPSSARRPKCSREAGRRPKNRIQREVRKMVLLRQGQGIVWVRVFIRLIQRSGRSGAKK